MSDTNLGELVVSASNLAFEDAAAIDWFDLDQGRTYIVVAEDTHAMMGMTYHEVVCKVYEDPSFGQVKYLGDLSIIGVGDSTGEPFVIYLLRYGDLGYLCYVRNNYANTIDNIACYKKAVTETETANRISFIKFLVSPKYPCLPKNIWCWKMAQKRGDS